MTTNPPCNCASCKTGKAIAGLGATTNPVRSGEHPPFPCKPPLPHIRRFVLFMCEDCMQTSYFDSDYNYESRCKCNHNPSQYTYYQANKEDERFEALADRLDKIKDMMIEVDIPYLMIDKLQKELRGQK